MSEFRTLLEAGDVQALRKAWGQLFPGMPQPETYEAAEIVMHRARTEANTVAMEARAWSHRWLTERGLPSGLPDRLKAKAERLYPVIVEGVGISVNTNNPALRPAMLEVRRAMELAVEDAYANGDRDPALVKHRMQEARIREMNALFGGCPR